MRGKFALIGFLVVQVIVVILWVMSVLPLMRSGSSPFISTASETFTGRIFSDLAFNFRSGETSVASPHFDPLGPLLWATLLMLAAAAAAGVSVLMFRRSKVWIAVGAASAGLLFGLGAAYFIVEQWSGDTTFTIGSVGPLWLYATSRVFLLQLFIGFALLALSIVAVIAGFATREKPLGFHFAALNWLIVAATWVISYLALYVAPPIFAGAGA